MTAHSHHKLKTKMAPAISTFNIFIKKQGWRGGCKDGKRMSSKSIFLNESPAQHLITICFCASNTLTFLINVQQYVDQLNQQRPFVCCQSWTHKQGHFTSREVQSTDTSCYAKYQQTPVVCCLFVILVLCLNVDISGLLYNNWDLSDIADLRMISGI